MKHEISAEGRVHAIHNLLKIPLGMWLARECVLA